MHFFDLSSRAHHLYLLCSFKRNVKGINHFVHIVVEKWRNLRAFDNDGKKVGKRKKKNLMHAACSPHKVEESDNKDFINGFISHQSLIFLLILASGETAPRKRLYNLLQPSNWQNFPFNYLEMRSHCHFYVKQTNRDNLLGWPQFWKLLPRFLHQSRETLFPI